MGSERMKARTVVSVAINSTVDLDQPVIVRLGLDDERTVGIGSWSSRDGHLVLTLTDDHDHFPVDRYVLGVPSRTVRRTHSEHRARGMFATDAEKAGPENPPPQHKEACRINSGELGASCNCGWREAFAEYSSML